MAAKAFAYLLNTLISLMDTGVNAVESIPYGVAENIMTDLPMAIMIALIICCTSVFLMGKHKSYLIMSIFLVCCFSSYRLLRNYQARNQKIFAVYSVNGHSAYDIIQGTSHTFIADSALMASVDKINYSIRPHWQEKGLHDPTIILLPEDDKDAMDYGICKMVKGQGLRMAVWSGEFPRCHPPHEKLMLDLLIIRGNCPFDMDAVFQWFDPAMVILDSSVPPWIKAPGEDRRYWTVREQGAFIVPSS